MALIHFFISYFFLLFTSSILIVSWHGVSRGQIEIQPDNSFKKAGNVFKCWHFFWMKEDCETKEFYKGYHFSELVEEIKKYFNHQNSIIMEVAGQEEFLSYSNCVFRASLNFINYIPLLEGKLNIKIKYLEDEKNGHGLFKIFYHTKHYIYPEPIRKIMTMCITCAPTFYGNVIYWTFIFSCKKTFLYQGLFSVFNNGYVGVLLIWLAFWLSLSYTCTFLWNKLNR